MKAILIDDEVPALRYLEKRVLEACPVCEAPAPAGDGQLDELGIKVK